MSRANTVFGNYMVRPGMIFEEGRPVIVSISGDLFCWVENPVMCDLHETYKLYGMTTICVQNIPYEVFVIKTEPKIVRADGPLDYMVPERYRALCEDMVRIGDCSCNFFERFQTLYNHRRCVVDELLPTLFVVAVYLNLPIARCIVELFVYVSHDLLNVMSELLTVNPNFEYILETFERQMYLFDDNKMLDLYLKTAAKYANIAQIYVMCTSQLKKCHRDHDLIKLLADAGNDHTLKLFNTECRLPFHLDLAVKIADACDESENTHNPRRILYHALPNVVKLTNAMCKILITQRYSEFMSYLLKVARVDSAHVIKRKTVCKNHANLWDCDRKCFIQVPKKDYMEFVAMVLQSDRSFIHADVINAFVPQEYR